MEINFRNKNFVFAAVAIIVGLCIIFLQDYIFPSTKNTPQIPINNEAEVIIDQNIPQNSGVSDQRLQNISITMGIPNYVESPANLPIYEYQSTKFLTEEKITEIITALKMQKIGDIRNDIQGQVISASNDTSWAVFEPDGHKFSIQYNPVKNGAPNFGDKQANEYLDIAKNYVTNWGIDLKDYSEVSFSFLRATGTTLQIINSGQNASVLRFNFTAKKDGHFLSDQKDSLDTNTISIALNPEGNVFDAKFELIGEIGNETERFAIKPNTVILQEIKNRQMKIIKADFPLVNPVTRVTITDIDIVYTNLDGKLTPVVRLTGNARGGVGETGKIQLAMDAVVK